MIIGVRIQGLRKSKGMTLKDLSAKINMSISFLSDIENSRSSPSLKRCKEIAAGLGVTVSELLGEIAQNTDLTSNNEKRGILTFSSPDAKQLSELLHDFDDWNATDKQELIAYLTAKRTARIQKGHKK